MVGPGPQLGQQRRVEVRAVGDDGPGPKPPVLEVLKEPPHVIVIVGPDQGEGHRQVTDRIGGQQQGELAQMQFIHTEGAAEVVQNLATVLGQIELAGPIAEEIVDEPRGEVQQEFAAERLEGPFDAHAVLDDPLQDQIADGVVIQGPGEDAVGGAAEGGAAVAARLVFATGDLQVGDGLVGDGPDPARRQDALAAAQPATLRAGGLLGRATNGYSHDCGCIGAHACVLSC